jgi:hypothetical protein
MSQEKEYKQNLDQVREKDQSNAEKNKENEKEKKDDPNKKYPQKELLNNLKKLPTMAKKMIFSVEIRDIFFIVAIGMAMLKDVSDLFGIGSGPVIGTVITIMTSITIAVGMLVSGGYGSGKKNKNNAKRAIKKWGILAGGTMVEMLFGINFLPVETLTALITFGMILLERAELKKEESSAEDSDDEEEYDDDEYD